MCQVLCSSFIDIGADTASIRILQHIHEHCQKVFIMMATRPIKDYNVLFIEKYRATGSYVEIPLNGLGADEIGEIILQNFDSGVDRISPEIVKVVQVSCLAVIFSSDINLLHRNALVAIRSMSSTYTQTHDS